MPSPSPDSLHRAVGDFLAVLATGNCRWQLTLAQHSLFRPDWHNAPRCLDEHLIFLITRGHGWIRTFDHQGGDRDEHLFAPGDLLWLAPGTYHATGTLDPDDPVGMYHLRFRLSHQGAVVPTAWTYAAIERGSELTPLVEGFIASYRRGGQDRDRELQAWLLLLTTAFRRGLLPGTSRGLHEDQKRRIEAYVQRHLHHAIDSADLATVAGLGRVHFTRLFRASYGCPPRTWIVKQRLQRAAILLLETELAAGTIAAELGYRSLPLFSRQFKQAHGIAPDAFRRGHRRGGFGVPPIPR